MGQMGNCVINHICREKNKVANCLANGGYNFDLGFVVLDEIPSSVEATFEDDLLRVPRSRTVSVI